MSEYMIQVAQTFLCTYVVEADSPQEAYKILMDGQGECIAQMPDAITSDYDEATIEATP